MGKIRKTAGTITAIILACSLCGCRVEFDDSTATSSGSEISVTVNAGIEPRRDTVVAHSTNGSGEEIEITYDDFRKEYMYFLVNNGVSNDNSAEIAEQCRSRRATLINTLINEQVIMAKAKELGLYEFTAEEQQAVDEEYNSRISQQIEYYVQQDGGSETSAMSDEEKQTFGDKKLDDMLRACGMTRNDLRWWATSNKIGEKLQEELGKPVTRAQAETEFKEIQKNAEELYKSDVSSYEQQGLAQIWLPEGSRLIKHVLLGFDDDTITELRALRADKKDDEANKLREDKAKALKSKQDEVEKKLDDGANIDDLIKEYSADASGSAATPDGYTVLPNGTTYVSEFQQAAFVPKKIGERTVCATDYGVHIMVYTGDASVAEESVKYYTDYIEQELTNRKFVEKMNEWREEYDFEINYEALRIDEPTNVSSVTSD